VGEKSNSVERVADGRLFNVGRDGKEFEFCVAYIQVGSCRPRVTGETLAFRSLGRSVTRWRSRKGCTGGSTVEVGHTPSQVPVNTQKQRSDGTRETSQDGFRVPR
jgi:hypothetical protein